MPAINRGGMRNPRKRCAPSTRVEQVGGRKLELEHRGDTRLRRDIQNRLRLCFGHDQAGGMRELQFLKAPAQCELLSKSKLAPTSDRRIALKKNF